MIRCEDENRWREDSDRGGDRDRERDMPQPSRGRGRGGLGGGDREYRRFVTLHLSQIGYIFFIVNCIRLCS